MNSTDIIFEVTICGFMVVFIWLLILQNNFNKLKEDFEQKIIKLSKLKDKLEDSVKKERLQYLDIDQKIIDSTLSKDKLPEENKPKYSVKQDETQYLTKKEQNIEEEDSQTYQQEGTGDFEKMFMENIFNKIGALALVVGIGIFIKLVSPTPPMQIIAGFLAGLAMILGSIKLHKNEMKNYAEALMGAGISVLFIATYCGCSLYHLLSIPVASVIGFLLILATYFIAEKYKTFSTIAIGLVGGYLNPFFINSNISPNFLFGYLIFLNLISIIYVQKNTDKVTLNFVNLTLTTLTIIFFTLSQHKGNAIYPSIIYPIILWTMYLVNDLFLIKNEAAREVYDKNNVLNWLNFGILIYFANFIFQYENKILIGATILSAGLIYLLCSYFAGKKYNELSKPYLYGFFLSVLISTYFLSEGTLRVCIWAVESLAISLWANKYQLKHIENWSLTFLLASFGAIFFVKDAVYVDDIQNYLPIFNFRTVLFAVPALSAYLSSKILLKNNEKISQLLQFLYISLIYLFVTLEINLLLSKSFATNVSNSSIMAFVNNMGYTIIGLVYAVQMKKLYNTAKYDLFNIAGYFIFAVALSTLLTMGLTFNPIQLYIPILNIRFAAFLTAIVASILYARWTKSEFFNYLAILLGALTVNCETNDLLTKIHFYDGNIILSTSWILYSGTIMLTGIFTKIKSLKLTGIWITIIAILKILLFDMKNVEPLYKIIAFISLGIILLLVSYFYTKRKGE